MWVLGIFIIISSNTFPCHKQGARWKVGSPGLEQVSMWDPSVCKERILATRLPCQNLTYFSKYKNKKRVQNNGYKMCGVSSILDPQLEHAQFILKHLDSSPGSSCTSSYLLTCTLGGTRDPAGGRNSHTHTNLVDCLPHCCGLAQPWALPEFWEWKTEWAFSLIHSLFLSLCPSNK